MFRFFRNIRQKLIEQDNVRKYIWYALGEIFLVVIGILIALQINNWNESKKTKAREKVIYENLMQGAITAQMDSERFIEAIESNISILESLLKNWNSVTYEEINIQFRPFLRENFSPIFNLTNYSQFYDPEINVYNSAVSDGSISLIQDKQFLRRLDRVYNYAVPRINELITEEYLLGQSINDHIAERYQSLFLEHTIADSTLYKPDLWTEKTYQEFFEEIRDDGVLKYKLSQRLELKRSRLLLINQAKTIIDNIVSE